SVGYQMVELGKNLEEALKMIKRAVDADPGNGHYLDSLGWAYFKLGRLEEAEKYLTEAARILELPVIEEHLGDVYQKQGKIEKAKSVWEKALSHTSDTEQAARIKEKLGGEKKK
ncbi:MAG TPA: tetratricopeptide repeat protein, partial [Blastocatellia bacterium]